MSQPNRLGRPAKSSDIWASTPMVEGRTGKGQGLGSLWHDQAMKAIASDNRIARQANRAPRNDPRREVISIESVYQLEGMVLVGYDGLGPIYEEVHLLDTEELQRRLSERHRRIRLEDARRAEKRRTEPIPENRAGRVDPKDRPKDWQTWAAKAEPKVITRRTGHKQEAQTCCGVLLPKGAERCDYCDAPNPRYVPKAIHENATNQLGVE